MSYAGGAAAAAAAAAAKKRREREEEKMTLESYSNKDLDGWEFKIVRTAFGSFGKPDKLKKVCDEEAAAGWELLEKLDNSRLRFKRRTSNRSGDQYRDTDAYRSYSGSDGSWIAIVITLGLIVAGLAAFFFISGGHIEISNPPVFLTTIGIIVLIVLLFVIRKKKRK